MSNFRKSQNEAHPNKTNTVMTGILLLLILFVSIQIWFLFGALNNALQENFYFALTTFIGSLILAICSLWLLRYLPDPIFPVKESRPLQETERIRGAFDLEKQEEIFHEEEWRRESREGSPKSEMANRKDGGRPKSDE